MAIAERIGVRKATEYAKTHFVALDRIHGFMGQYGIEVDVNV